MAKDGRDCDDARLDDETEKGLNRGGVAGWITGIVVLQVVFGSVAYFAFDDWQDRGAFGDMFGALNALFSGLAFLGVIYAIILQKRELQLQRKELSYTRKELKRTAEAQQAMLVLQKEAFRIEQRRAQPMFTLKTSSQYRPETRQPPQGSVLHLSLDTSGPPATVTNVRSDGVKIELTGQGLPALLQGNEATFAFKALHPVVDKESLVFVDYQDEAGEKRTATFIFHTKSGRCRIKPDI